MNESNPFSAPQTEASVPLTGNENLEGLNFDELKKLYHRSCNVNVINALLILGFFLLAIASIVPGLPMSLRMVLMGFTAFYAIAIVGLFIRSSWGRILGIIVSVLTLLGMLFNLSTGNTNAVGALISMIVGIAGLFAFIGSPQLFGPDRFTHKELKAEFKLQKRSR